MRVSLRHFNSIKVRLERVQAVCTLMPPFHFNSIKVRLELGIIGTALGAGAISIP